MDPTEPTLESRPLIWVTTDESTLRERAWQAVVEANDPAWPQVMVRGPRLVRYLDPDPDNEAGSLAEFNWEVLKERMSQTARYAKGQTEAGDPKYVNAPQATAKLILARGVYPGAPPVDSIVTMPFLSVDRGTVVHEAGYHESDRVILQPAVDVHVSDGPPTLQHVEDAVEFLTDDWLGDFCFADQASRANALGLALLPFVRPFIKGPTPMHLINAAQPGTGKSLLTQVALMPGCGTFSFDVLAGWDSEFERKMTAKLMSGPQVIWFDNQSDKVDSSLLTALLSGPTYEGRPMGKSTMVKLPVRNVWAMTGNNLAFTRELADRGVLIQLDPGDEVVPRYREAGWAKHDNLETWTMENRAAIAGACLTLIRHWLAGEWQKGEHGAIQLDQHGELRHEHLASTAVVKATFEPWSECIGGILAAAEVEGFLVNSRDLKERVDTDTSEVRAFIEAIAEFLPAPWTTAELVLASELPGAQDLRDAVPLDLQTKAGRGMGLKVALGYWLKANKDAWHGDYRVVVAEDGRKKRWTVQKRELP